MNNMSVCILTKMRLRLAAPGFRRPAVDGCQLNGIFEHVDMKIKIYGLDYTG
jgi:hypothetical protein